ncbi:unnamed protein product, partial [marine sediment metagenome]
PLAVWPQENGRWVFQGESFRLIREAGEAVIVTVLPGKGRRP